MKVKVFEQDLTGGGKLAILIGGMDSENPKELMNQVVHEYVNNRQFNDFVDIHSDDAYVRVIIMGINELDYREMEL